MFQPPHSPSITLWDFLLLGYGKDIVHWTTNFNIHSSFLIISTMCLLYVVTINLWNCKETFWTCMLLWCLGDFRWHVNTVPFARLRWKMSLSSSSESVRQEWPKIELVWSKILLTWKSRWVGIVFKTWLHFSNFDDNAITHSHQMFFLCPQTLQYLMLWKGWTQ